jgi:hypothetical protein
LATSKLAKNKNYFYDILFSSKHYKIMSQQTIYLKFMTVLTVTTHVESNIANGEFRSINTRPILTSYLMNGGVYSVNVKKKKFVFVFFLDENM